MDLSKLPKLSDTQAAKGDDDAPAAEPVPVAAIPRPVDYRDRAVPSPPEVGVDVWISTIVGLLCVGLGLSFGKFLVAKAAHRPFSTGVTWQTGPLAGQEVAYFDLLGYTAWQDTGVFLFGISLLFEAASKALFVLRPGKVSRGLILLTIGLTVVTTVLNGIACVLILGTGLIPLTNGLAVAFGGWVLFDGIKALQAARLHARTAVVPR